MFFAHDVPAAVQAAVAAADDDIRQRVMIVSVAVAHVAAIEKDRVIEKRAVAVFVRVELADEIGEQPDVVCLDLGEPLELVGAILVVRHRVMAFGDTNLRVGSVADLTRHHEREHARDVGAIGEREEVEHQADVLGVLEWNAGRCLGHVDIRVLRALRLRADEPPLDLAHAPSRYSSSVSRSCAPRSRCSAVA